MIFKYFATPQFFENRHIRFTQPGALNDSDEARPDLSVGKYTPEDYAKARTQASRAGFYPASDSDLEAIFMNPFPNARYDEKHFPGLPPAYEPRLRKEPFSRVEEFDRAIAERAIEQCLAWADRSVGVLSLSASREGAMWAYYADDNYGIAVGFDEQHSFFGNAKAVSYSNEPISVSINSEWVRIGGVRWETEDILNSRIVQIPDELLFRKGTGWLHESEWRMVRSLANANMTLEKSDRNGFAICLYEVPPEAVRLVIFGYRVPDSIVDETIERIVKGGQLEHLQIYRRKRTNIGRVEEERIR